MTVKMADKARGVALEKQLLNIVKAKNDLGTSSSPLSIFNPYSEQADQNQLWLLSQQEAKVRKELEGLIDTGAYDSPRLRSLYGVNRKGNPRATTPPLSPQPSPGVPGKRGSAQIMAVPACSQHGVLVR